MPESNSPQRPARTWPIWGLLLAIVAVGVTSQVMRALDNPQGDPLEDASDAHRPRLRADTLPQSLPILGVSLNCHHIGTLDLYLQSVDRIAELGADTLFIITPMFQTDVASTDIRIDPAKCPSRDQLEAIFARARHHGLRTGLVPIVLLDEPGETDWRGVLAPPDWDAWWTSYESRIGEFLDLARDADVDVFSIGSELNSTEDQPERWAMLIEQARANFDGLLTYAANWDRYDRLDFWSDLDIISISAYFELAPGTETPSPEALRDAWDFERRLLLQQAREIGRPLVLVELGYPSLPWAHRHPWNYVAPSGTRADHIAQDACFDAFFDAWASDLMNPGATMAGGFCIYHWDPYRSGDPYDTGYGLFGKPALETVRAGLARVRDRTGPTSRPARESILAPPPTGPETPDAGSDPGSDPGNQGISP